jgi:hypothetical protein
VMTYSRCCMTERLACWDNFYLKMVDQFRVICAEGIPSGQPKLREKWFNLTIEEQLNLVLGAWDQPEIQPCACSVPRSTPTDLITSYLGVQ